MTKGSTQVICNGYLIEAIYKGEMTTELLNETNAKIRTYVEKGCKCILYNTLDMNKPEMKHSLMMKQFDQEIGPKLNACATVTSNPATAFMAKLAFIFTPNHRVFYNQLDEAKTWLMASRQLQVA